MLSSILNLNAIFTLSLYQSNEEMENKTPKKNTIISRSE
jgi:hypothetical protein